jgi:hypothetical protein
MSGPRAGRSRGPSASAVSGRSGPPRRAWTQTAACTPEWSLFAAVWTRGEGVSPSARIRRGYREMTDITRTGLIPGSGERRQAVPGAPRPCACSGGNRQGPRAPGRRKHQPPARERTTRTTGNPQPRPAETPAGTGRTATRPLPTPAQRPRAETHFAPAATAQHPRAAGKFPGSGIKPGFCRKPAQEECGLEVGGISSGRYPLHLRPHVPCGEPKLVGMPAEAR